MFYGIKRCFSIFLLKYTRLTKLEKSVQPRVRAPLLKKKIKFARTDVNFLGVLDKMRTKNDKMK